MKTLSLALVALAAGLSPAAAVAQTRTVTTHTEMRTHTGPAFGHGRHHEVRRVCRVYRDHGHRVRSCRTVRR